MGHHTADRRGVYSSCPGAQAVKAELRETFGSCMGAFPRFNF